MNMHEYSLEVVAFSPQRAGREPLFGEEQKAAVVRMVVFDQDKIIWEIKVQV